MIQKIDQNDIRFFSGSSHPELARRIAAYLDVPLEKTRFDRFSNDNLFIQLGASVRSRAVFVVVTQRVMRRDPQLLPEWTDLGVMFLLGLKYCVVYFLYMLPILIMVIPIIPLGILSEMSGQGEVFGIVLLIYTFGMLILMTLYSIGLVLMIPVISFRFAERERISDALDIGEVFRLFGKNWQSVVVVVLIAVAAQSFAWLGIIVFIVGILFTIFYSYLVSSFLSGLLYLESREKGA